MLPLLVKWNFERMLADGSLNERERAFFTDKRLVKFWSKVGDYLSGVNADYREIAASMLVGGFINPIKFGYGDAGTKEQPTRKTRIRTAQSKADPVINRVASLAGELADALDKLEETTSMHPCEVRFLHVVQPLICDEAVQNLSGYWLGVRTSEALRFLQKQFDDYPEAAEIFRGVPGMASQKSSWVDWMREAESNLAETVSVYPGKLSLTEANWVSLANVLCGEHVTRNAVQAARKGCNTQPE